jgi:hypothetical protein
MTRAGRTINRPRRYIGEIGAAPGDYEIGLTALEIQYYAAIREFPAGNFAPVEVVCVGAGLGGGFENTKELHVMKYNKGYGNKGSQGMEASCRRRARLHDQE